jgi:collagenase-like PrtC family protease
MIIASLENISYIDFYKTYANGIVVYTNDFSSFYNKAYDLEEIKEIYEKKDDLMMFVDVSSMMENKDILNLSKFIDSLKDLDIYYYFSDLGVFQLLKDKGLGNRGVYNPSTLLTNHLDVKFYLDCGMLSCQVANEIPVSDIEKISKHNSNNIFFKSFGYHQMFHSKRNLISLYKEHKNLDFDIDPMNMFLKEQKRDDLYHIYQGNHGTLLFRSYVINYIEEILTINPCYIFLDNIFIDSDTFKSVLKTYSDFLTNKISIDEALKNLSNTGLDIQDGFKFNDTVYQKEKSNE